MEDLLKSAGMLSTATNIKVFAPDGFSQYFPLNPDPIRSFTTCSASIQRVSITTTPSGHCREPAGWCDYSSPAASGLNPGNPIENEDGLKLMLATLRDGENLDPGVLTPQTNSTVKGLSGSFRLRKTRAS